MKRGDLKYRSTEGYINHGLVEDERSHRSQEPGHRRLMASSRAPSQLSVSGRQSRQQKLPQTGQSGPLSYRSGFRSQYNQFEHLLITGTTLPS